MFGKRRKKQKNEQAAITTNQVKDEETWGEYAPTLQDIIATSSKAVFKRNHALLYPNSYRRTYYVTRMHGDH